MTSVINIVFAGLGGQGVLTASDICAEAAFRAGLDVKKSEIHGMSQRGGSVSSDVRIGPSVASPMVPAGQADYLVVLDETQVELNRPMLRAGGVLLSPAELPGGVEALPNRKCLNVAMLGALASHLDIDPAHWLDAVAAHLPQNLLEMNRQAFTQGHAAAK